MRIGKHLLVALFVIAAVARAGDLGKAEPDLRADELDRIKRGAAELRTSDSAESVAVIVRVLRATDKKFDKASAKFDKTCARASENHEKSMAILTDLIENPGNPKRNRLRSEAIKLGNEGHKLWLKAIREFAPIEMRINASLQALHGLRSPEAVTAIVRQARLERPGRVQWWLMSAIVSRSEDSVVALMIELMTARDARTRALAARSLVEHAEKPGVADVLAIAAADDHWQMRRFAYAGLGRAKRHDLLDAALARETGDDLRAARIARQGADPEEPAGPLGFRWTSMRIRIVVDTSKSAASHLPKIQEELSRAIEAAPEGALLQIVAVGAKAKPLSRSPLRLNAAARRKAIKWVGSLTAGGPANRTQFGRAMLPSYDHPSKGRRVFKDLPDAIYVVLGPDEELNEPTLVASHADWFKANPSALFVRVYGAAPSEGLRTAVEAQGGKIHGG
ncbi:MAG: hypothetical protein AAGD14_00550 [Planctomycetota bacterium]